MAMSAAEKNRVVELATIERLLSDGLRAIAQDKSANAYADRLFNLATTTADTLVAEAAEAAYGGISSGQLTAASRSLASVNDLIATATNAFSLASRIAKEREAALTLPFIAGKAATMLELVTELKAAAERVVDAHDLSALVAAISDASTALGALRDEAEAAA